MTGGTSAARRVNDGPFALTIENKATVPNDPDDGAPLGLSWEDWGALDMAFRRRAAFAQLCDDDLDRARWLGLHDDAWPDFLDELRRRGLLGEDAA